MKIPKLKLPSFRLRMKLKPTGFWALLIPVMSKKAPMLHNAASLLDIIGLLGVLPLSAITAYYSFTGIAAWGAVLSVVVLDPIAIFFLILAYGFIGIATLSLFSGRKTRALLGSWKIRLRFILKYATLSMIALAIMAAATYYSYTRSDNGLVNRMQQHTTENHRPPKTLSQAILPIQDAHQVALATAESTYNNKVSSLEAQIKAIVDEETASRNDESNYYKGSYNYKLSVAYANRLTTKQQEVAHEKAKAYEAWQKAIASQEAIFDKKAAMIEAEVLAEWDGFNRKMDESKSTAELSVAAFTVLGLILRTLSSVFRIDEFKQFAISQLTIEAQRVRENRSNQERSIIMATGLAFQIEKINFLQIFATEQKAERDRGFIEKAQIERTNVLRQEWEKGLQDAEKAFADLNSKKGGSEEPQKKNTSPSNSALDRKKTKLKMRMNLNLNKIRTQG